MKFQKTLLAVSLALATITANAEISTSAKSDVYQYQKEVDGTVETIYTINGKQYVLEKSEDTAEPDIFVEVSNTVDLSKSGYELVRGGQLDTDIQGDGKPVTSKIDSVLTITEGVAVNNADPSYKGYTLTTGTQTETSAVNTNINGVITNATGNAQDINAGFSTPASLVQTVQQADLKNGLIANDQIGVSNILSEKVITDGVEKVTGIVSGTALTNKGLTLFGKIDPQAEIDYNTGKVTVTKTTGGTSTGNKELKAYSSKEDSTAIDVLQFNGKYYSVDANNQLTEYTGSTDKLVDLGAGVATGLNDAKTETSTTQAFVGSAQTVYGEEKSSYSNANTVTVGSADPDAVLEAGKEYNFGNVGDRTSSSKNVVTGILATDENGSNTYGLQATNTVNGNIVDQTTVVATGIKTTGDVVINGNKSVSDSLNRLESGFAGLSNNVSELNRRVDDVEKTSYRGIAVALATQQQIPNIGAGQFAVFGGAGHYKGESAGAVGVASVFADGRTSVSAAVGFSGGNEVGGRLGVAYVFGGK